MVRSVAYCQLCGRRLSGKGRIFHHDAWPAALSLRVCPDCARRKPRCQECGLPMAEPVASGLCETCQSSLPCCLSCGRSITGRIFAYDGVGPYCPDCVRKRQKCDLCNAPLTDEQWKLSDGRLTCAHCQKSAVFTPEEATSLFQDMRTIVSDQMEIRLNIPTGLALVDQNQLQDVIQHQSRDSDGEAMREGELDSNRTLGIYARRGMRRGIYVQIGLPRTLFLQVAAHEYAHAWQGENCPTLRDATIHEGFAEWVAYRVIGSYGYRDSQEKMLARRDVYGRGLRWALETEARQNAQAVIDACRNRVLLK